MKVPFCLFLSGAILTAAQFKPIVQDTIVPSGSKLELVWAAGQFTEGPTLGPDGAIFFSDIGNRTMRFAPATGRAVVFREPSGKSNGLIMDRRGSLIACEGAREGGNRRVPGHRQGICRHHTG